MQWPHDPALTVAVALASGMVGQAVSHHLRVPGIALLLGIGVGLGPDGLGVVQPDSLGDGLRALVGIAVAVILFEGGLSLDLRRIRREQRSIQQLITVGALTSLGVGAALAALVLGWDWRLSLLFGTLVVVTGPTVVTPLLRRLRVQRNVETVLHAEGVFVDAIGAITAVVALELVLRPTNETWALAAPNIAGRLAFGAAAGLLGGALLAALLRFGNVVPERIANPFALAWAILVFAASNAVLHESGIAAVTVAGMVVGNTKTSIGRELAEFKEQLTIMLVGMLFVLLVADVRVDEVIALGLPGAVVAGGAVLLVRPLSVWAGTAGAGLPWRERAFLAWIGPRGIVAAAVASFFGYELAAADLDGGTALRAMVFTVIAVTVLVSALTGGLAARALDLRRRRDDGWLVLGGNALALAVARALSARGTSVVAIDSDPSKVAAYEALDLRAVHGNALEDRTRQLARIDEREGAIALTGNDEVNQLFVQKARLEDPELRYAVALTDHRWGVTLQMVKHVGAEWLFAADVDVSRWSGRIQDGHAETRWYRVARAVDGAAERVFEGDPIARGYLPLVVERDGRAEPVTDATELGGGATLAVLVQGSASEHVDARLRANGLERVAPQPGTELACS